MRESCVLFLRAEDGIRGAQECRGLGEVYKGQGASWEDNGASLASRAGAAMALPQRSHTGGGGLDEEDWDYDLFCRHR